MNLGRIPDFDLDHAEMTQMSFERRRIPTAVGVGKPLEFRQDALGLFDARKIHLRIQCLLKVSLR
jgi:hypothetical protein